jgi:2-dehydro-3-deoxygluconokinase
MTEQAKVFLGLGECMVELSPRSDGSLQQGFAGDVFNTLWYAARALGPEWQVRFHSAFGQDALSQELIAFAQAAGVDCSAAPRLQGSVPGLYMIRLNAGERSFLYWRGQSAARRMMEDRAHVEAQITAAQAVYLSGITLAILPPQDRAALIALIAQAREAGALVAFDPNIRPALWENADTMRATLGLAARAATIVLPSFDDEAAAFGDATPEATAARYGACGADLVVVKNGNAPVVTLSETGLTAHPTPPLGAEIVDSTAAGDSFNAAFLAEYLRSHNLGNAVRAGQRLAATVIQGRGALVAPS